MKYEIKIINDDGDVRGIHDLSLKEAKRVAQAMAKKDLAAQVYITWYRRSDGQHGYYNHNGHNITGRPW